MKISTSDMKVRATELLLVTRGAKATIIALRRLYKKFRSSYPHTGKTGVPKDPSTNRENEINEARVGRNNQPGETILDENELANFAKENLENELREVTMSRVAIIDNLA